MIVNTDAEMLLQHVRGCTHQGTQCTSKERLPPKWVCARPAGRIDWGYLEVATVHSFKDEDLWWPVDKWGHVLPGASEKAYPELNAAVEQKDDQRTEQQKLQECEASRKWERRPTPPSQPMAARAPACRRVRKTQ